MFWKKSAFSVGAKSRFRIPIQILIRCVYCGAYHPAIQPSYQSAVLLFHTHPLLQLWVALPFSPACLFCCPLYSLSSQDQI